MNRRTRIDEAFDIICEYASVNNGCTPSSRALADMMGISRQYASGLLNRLDNKRKIEWVTRNSYKVVPSVWTLTEVEKL